MKGWAQSRALTFHCVRHDPKTYRKTKLLCGGQTLKQNADGTWQEQDRRKRLLKFFKAVNPSKLRDVDNMLQRYQGREAILFKRIEAKYEKRIPLVIKKHTVKLPKKTFKSRKWNSKRLIEQRLLADDYDFYTDAKLQRKISLPTLEHKKPKKVSPRRWVPPGSPESRPQELSRVD